MKMITQQDLSRVFKAKVLKNELITPLESAEDIYELTLSIGNTDKDIQIGQSLGLVLEGPFEFGNQYHFRLYTIIEYDDSLQEHTIKLCIKRCFYIDDVNGQQYPGIASNYLCDRKVGDEISLLGPFDRPFHIPEDPNANIVMIGMGTGIAPFRAFIRHLYNRQGEWQGQVRLLYGARTGLEMLYMNDKKNDISQYYDEETFTAIQAISSRPYGDVNASVADSISNSLRENASEVWKLIQSPGSHLFIAGLEVMQDRLNQTFADLAGTASEWQKTRELMKRENRYQDIIY